jgi:hypothetical protein
MNRLNKHAASLSTEFLSIGASSLSQFGDFNLLTIAYTWDILAWIQLKSHGLVGEIYS